MSMGPEAYNKKKWRGLNSLQSALSMTQLDDDHYGYSSAHYNKFESLSDLLHISLLVLDNVDKIPYSGDLETFKDAEFHEMKRLAEEPSGSTPTSSVRLPAKSRTRQKMFRSPSSSVAETSFAGRN